MGLRDALSGIFGGGDEDGGEPDDELAELFGGDGDGDGAGGGRDGDPGDAREDPEGEDGETTAAEFRAEAEEFAADHDDEPFDFTRASLDALDEYAADQGELLGTLAEDVDDGGGEFLDQVHGGFTVSLGSYFGEVLVREYDGEWVEEDGWAVAVPVDGGALEVAVFDVAALSLGDEPAFAETAAELEATLADAATADAAGAAAAADAGAAAATDERADATDAGADAESPYAAEAAELAAYWEEYDLDVTPASLARLDDLVDAQWENERFRDAELGGEGVDGRVFTGLVQQLGCYYGEVLVRRLDGEWVEDDDLGTAVEVPGEGDADVVANVFHVAEDCLTEPSKFALSFDTVADQAGRDLEPVDEGGYVVSTEAERDEGGDPAAAGEALDPRELVAEFREDAADLVERHPGYDLDYTPESLERLDRLAAEEATDFDLADVPLGDETDGDSLFLTARAMEAGGYLAEVFRRNLGGEWRTDDGLVFAVEGRDAAAQFDPVAVAAEVFRGEDSFAATYEAIRGRLSVPERGEPAPAGAGRSDGADAGRLDGPDAGQPDADPRTGKPEAADGPAGEPDGPEPGGPRSSDDRKAPSVGDADPGDPPRGAAEAFAADAERDLDFTPESLARLDDLAADFDPGLVEDVAPGLAAYLGETFVRSYGATWTYSESAGWVVELADAGGDEQVLVLPTVLEDCLEGGATFAAVHDAFVDRLGVDGPRLTGEGSFGADGDETLQRFAEETAAEPASEPAERVGERHREAAAALVEEWPGYDLDYTVESLVRLDALVADHYDESGGDRDYEGDPLTVPEGTTLSFGPAAEEFGGYLAAVFERHHGGAWRRTDGGDAVLVVEGPAATAELEPDMVAIACFAGESAFVDAYARVAADVGLEPPLGG